MTKGLNRRLLSLEGFLGGHLSGQRFGRGKQILTKRRRARDEARWREEEGDG